MKHTQKKGSSANQIHIGTTLRVTVLTPNCLRIEEDAAGKFTDAPTLFAQNRKGISHDFTCIHEKNAVIIDTGIIRLSCPENARNTDALNAIISASGKKINWQAGMKNSDNLGGTAETLDGWNEAHPLSDGLLSRDGWYLLDDSGTPVLENGWIKRRASTGKDWYLFGYGSDYRAALRSLAEISGPVPMPRRYTLGAWYSRYWPYTSKEYREIVAEYKDKDFPLDMIVMDMDWHINDARKAFGPDAPANTQVWTGYTWDRDILPDAEKLLAWFHKQGLAVTLNDHPADGVRPFEKPYAPFMRALGKDPKSKEAVPFDAADRKYMEAFYEHTHANLEKDGVDFWWLDWQQYRDTLSLPGLTNLQWLNYLYYQKVRKDGKRGQSFSRWGGWGDHRNPIHFSGDAHTNWEMLAAEVPFTATAGNVGCFFWSHDIGGHQGGRNEESYARWCQFGALSAALRSHSTRNEEMDRRPWTYDKWAENSMRDSFHLRSELFPYIYTSVARSCQETIPLTRPMYIDYPEVDDAYRNPQQYLFGENLLVAPVCEPGLGKKKLARQAVWFPDGVWYNYFSGERFTGSCEKLVASTIDEFPLFVRGGVALPMREYTPRMATAILDKLVLRCWPGPSGQSFSSELYEDDGISEGYRKKECARTTFTTTRNGDELCLTVSQMQGNYPGCVKKRAYIIELPETLKPGKTLLDGRQLAASYNSKKRLTRIEIPARAVTAGFTLTITAACAPADLAQLQAFQYRTDLGKKAASLTAALQEALKSGGGKADAALRAAGVGLFAKNETAYGYPADPTYILYTPALLQAEGMLDLQLASTKWKHKIKGEKTVIPVAAAMLKLPVPQGELMASRPSFTLQGTLQVNKNELRFEEKITLRRPFWEFKENRAPSAEATASSWMPDQPPAAAIDGVIDGIPGDRFREWASNNQGSGAWLRLGWKKPVNAGRVALYDRPNHVDHITSGVLFLSDGSILPVGELPNCGTKPFEVTFSPRKLDWLVFVVTGVSKSTTHTGISEIAVY